MHTGIRYAVRLFLASPSDLGPERKLTRQVVEAVNKEWSESGLLIELYGWEEQPPGAGRPQDLINSHVDTCDVFLGLLWKRWGQPTGTHASGFLEEFERAMARRRLAGTPDIWLALRAIDTSDQNDPGPQLQEVLKFRARVTQGKEILYQEYGELEDYRERLRHWLVTCLLRRLRASETPGSPSQRAEQASVGPALTQQESTARVAPTSLTEAATAVASALSNEKDYFDGVLQIGYRPLARLGLHCRAWLSCIYGEEGLSVHEANRIYQDRAKLDLTPPEVTLLADALVSDEADVVPGWYWFRDALDGVALLNDFIGRASGPARVGALGLLARLGARLGDGLLLDKLIADSASHDDRVLAGALVRYLAASGSAAELLALQRPELTRRGDLPQLAAARQQLLLRIDTERALREVAARVEAPQNPLYEAIERGAELPAVLLERLLSHPDHALRRGVTQYLMARKELPESTLRALAQDVDPRLRRAALAGLLASGANITLAEIDAAFAVDPADKAGLSFALLDLDELRLEVIARLPAQEIEAMISWSDVRGPLAYTAMGLAHFEVFGERVRRDLREGFEAIRVDDLKRRRDLVSAKLKEVAPSVSMAEAELDQLIADKLSWAPSLDKFVRDRYVAAALTILERHGAPSDAVFARDHITGDAAEVRLAAVRLLSRRGDTADAATLLSLATSRSTYGPAELEAIGGAVALSGGGADIIRILLSSSALLLVRAGLRSLRARGIDEALRGCEPLLKSEGADIRLAALALIVELAERSTLEDLLERYRRQGSYYYNVGCWLDRVLYAPPPLQGLFRRELAAKLEG